MVLGAWVLGQFSLSKNEGMGQESDFSHNAGLALTGGRVHEEFVSKFLSFCRVYSTDCTSVILFT
jgi:hypothetical protein